MNIQPIRNEDDYRSALNRAEQLIEAKPNTNEFDELEVLTALIERYEEVHYLIETPDPIEAIKFRMEQEGLIQKDLIPFLGNKTRVSEILNKKRKLTIDMIRNLHAGLHIPFENLIGEYNINSPV
ncbi:MAG: DNA-binding protein [Sulfurovum sp.]|nr:DNA-binding protein [Sulfurovum sp.]